MDKQLNDAPCGFLALSEEGSIIAANRTLIKILDYEPEQVIGQHMNMMLTIPAPFLPALFFSAFEIGASHRRNIHFPESKRWRRNSRPYQCYCETR